ncbi:hypothetical protein XACJK4_1490004 [Xanthomonas citri pv. citri]|nr:hypothetical protein XACJK2_830003 [Xanthomonas citri pv. citri]CEH70310.1 hypothetical protein XACLH37_1330003 [Xanthomonas citri pv. citri]CEH96339.1 hypothetical protein XACG115_1480003 [Xanthomonas citri pv. citri]CEL38268.1 hypothetical protein XACJK4_1490004 [Xanthomonas citri pv. citri]
MPGAVDRARFEDEEFTSLRLIGCCRFHGLYPSLIYVTGIIAAQSSAAASFPERRCNGSVLSTSPDFE